MLEQTVLFLRYFVYPLVLKRLILFKSIQRDLWASIQCDWFVLMGHVCI